MSDKSDDEGDSKLRHFYCQLAREGDDEVMGSQESTTSELTPLTPEVVTGNYPPLTAAERGIAEAKIIQAGEEGLRIPGLKSKVVYSPPNQNRTYGLFSLVSLAGSGGRFICAVISNCVRIKSTTMEPIPKCELHKGEQVGFVLCQFTDDANKKNDVILHAIASFTYIYGDEKGKNNNATRAIMSQNLNKTHSGWTIYSEERKSAKKPTPVLKELETRRRYYDEDDEYGLMKVYAARQTTTLFKMLLWPDTTIKIICLNTMINFPNGAYKELVEEMDICGLELKIHDKLSSSAAAALNLEPAQEIPFLLRAEQGESIEELLTRGRQEKKGEKVAALYFVSNTYVIYAGQALSGKVHMKQSPSDPVIDYKNNKPPSHPDYKNVPIGLVREGERYRWEFHLHMCALIASLLQLKNSITSKDFKPLGVGHPICINRQANSNYVDKNSWGIINGYLMKKFSVAVYLGPKQIID
ncbi:uncharacterized protein LOC110862531 [Folsomia candida]|uniref:uncharacterized protein LOC110862531 n=1 Tax=Folsomia candida TaxID=158441 RepID=UPI000B9045A4|nr:uncharacterized protein LOC110862531 [Folsomia candida]XP_035701533.1 uncharacterized protein LOC110862531 [Folsomia candida]